MRNYILKHVIRYLNLKVNVLFPLEYEITQINSRDSSFASPDQAMNQFSRKTLRETVA